MACAAAAVAWLLLNPNGSVLDHSAFRTSFDDTQQ